MKMTRDLLILSGIAFREGNYPQAGILFAAAMNSNDCEDFFQELGANSSLSALAGAWKKEKVESDVDFVAVVDKLAKAMQDEDNFGNNFAVEASEGVDDAEDGTELNEDLEDDSEFDEDGNPLLEFDPSSEDGILIPPSFAASRPVKLRPGTPLPDDDDEEQATVIEID